jgi:DNA-binding NtrC family response regulator
MYLSPNRISFLCDVFYRGLKAAERLEYDPEDEQARAELKSVLQLKLGDRQQDSERIAAALQEAENMEQAAQILNMPKTTLYEHVAALGLETPTRRKRRCGSPSRRRSALREAA